MKMNNKLGVVILFVTTIIFSACKKDPYDGVVSNERSIEAVTLGGGLAQIGPAVVDRLAGTVAVKVLMQSGTDLSSVSAQIQTSYKSDIKPASGEKVNFAANNNKYTYTITSESGKTREWVIELIPFTETLLGTYAIQKQVVYGGTGPEYGGGEVIDFSAKPWLWSATTGPSLELDNRLTFEFEGVAADGKTFGKVTNSAGADGKYANYVFTATPQTDVNSFYRKIPVGVSKWERDYTANVVKFTSSTGVITTATFRSPGTISLGNNTNKTITDNSFDFTLNGIDDWGNIYSDYDKVVKKPRRFWIDVKKQ
jgi:hypothetical protein